MTDWFCAFSGGGAPWWLLPIHAIGGLAIGFWWGLRKERNSWMRRCGDDVPMRADGQWFFVRSGED